MIRFALAALAVGLIFTPSHAAAKSYGPVTRFCGDRVCGWFPSDSGARVRRAKRNRYVSHETHRRAHHKIDAGPGNRAVGSVSRRPSNIRGRIVAHPAGCPRVAFCGCGVAHSLGINDRSLWLARNWLRFPRTLPAPGMVAARAGHVFKILALIRPGVVLAYDPNSGGHMTRVHERRLAGFSVRNPHARMASR